MIKVAVAGLGKMGLSHLAMIRPHPDVEMVGVCDSSTIVLDVLAKYTGLPTFSDYEQMLERARPDAVLLATPSHLHAPMARTAIERGMHVFCEKPLFLDTRDGDQLTELATNRGLVTQVGYHNKFVGAFQEVKRLLDLGAIGAVNDALAEAYGPVVLKPTGRSWRSSRNNGGGCLYDYAAHPIDLLNWYLGEPEGVSGSSLTTIFSRETDDAVASTLHYGHGATAQLRANWSDDSQRKMTTKISIWGSTGRIYADRQEVQVYLRDNALIPEGYRAGWTVRYTTELSTAPWFYLRGEEYSNQLDTFVSRVRNRRLEGPNTFTSACATDRVIDMILRDSSAPARVVAASAHTGALAGGPATSARNSGSRALGAVRRRATATANRVGPPLQRVRSSVITTIKERRRR